MSGWYYLEAFPPEVTNLRKTKYARAVVIRDFRGELAEEPTPAHEFQQIHQELDAMEKDSKLLTSKEVAQILDCSPDDVILLAQKGKLQAIKEGRFWRFRQSDVMAFKANPDMSK